MQSYVVGFMFSYDEKEVVLVRKAKPEWQKGFLNGVGGKIEPDEGYIDAMVREFREETGMDTETYLWRKFARLVFTGGVVHFYMTRGETGRCSTQPPQDGVWEQIERVPVAAIPNMQTIPNLRWLIPLALDKDHVVASVEDPT